MQHTYLRYECGDAFGLITSSSSSKAPQSNSTISCVNANNSTIILTTGGSHCLGYHLKTSQPTIKISHRERLSGGVGTGKALNSDHIVCLDVASPTISSSSSSSTATATTNNGNYVHVFDDEDGGRNYYKVATGWVDGTVRVFDVSGNELSGHGGSNERRRRYYGISNKGCGLVQSLLSSSSNSRNDDDGDDDDADEFIMREPLVLNGHSGSPIRAISFDKSSNSNNSWMTKNAAVTRLASGSNDGSVVLWDIVAETGLFRLLGHRGGITDLNFVSVGSPTTPSTTSGSSSMMDLLVSSSLDGLVKIWDLQGQCCIQTIATHMGEVWAASCISIPDANYAKKLGNYSNDEDNDSGSSHDRVRLVTGSSDGQTRVWSIEPSKRSTLSTNDGHDGSTNANIMAQSQEMTNADNKSPAIVEDENGADVAAASRSTPTPSAEENMDDVCHYMGTLSAPPNVSTSAERIDCLHFHPNGKYAGVLHANSKNIDVYLIRSDKEAQRKKRRRLKRRKEKSSKGGKDQDTENNQTTKGGQKRGLLDDPDSEDDEQHGQLSSSENILTAVERKMDPEKLKASDEFEYFGTVRASHKLKGFVFVPGKVAGGGVKIVCALATNAMETHVLKKKRYNLFLDP